MKHLILVFALGTLTFIGYSPTSIAAPDPAGCTFHFRVKIRSTVVVQTGGGSGYLACKDIDGKKSRAKVSINIDGLGLGLGVFRFEGVSGNLGILDPRKLEGEYYIADANIGVGPGGGLSLGLYNQQTGLSIDAKIKGGTGVGAAINGSKWTIRLID